MGSVKNITIASLKIIPTNGGNVMHALRSDDIVFKGFGEAYFSNIRYGEIKAWKKHKEMTLNLVVPIGSVLFYFLDDYGAVARYIIGERQFQRLTVPPGIWFGFKGIDKDRNMLLNIADIKHNPNEVERKLMGDMPVDWNFA